MAPGAVLLLLSGIVATLLPDAAESRVLLTLDDFGAVGDGVANDTQVPMHACPARGPALQRWLVADRQPRTPHSLPQSPGFLGRVERRVRLQPGDRPRRAGWQGLPDLAGAALWPQQEQAQAVRTYVLRNDVRRVACTALELFTSVVCCLLGSRFPGRSWRRLAPPRGSGRTR
jgi:hypothetical protein